MQGYTIIYTVGDSQVARRFYCDAESDGEAVERFEHYAEGFDDGYELVEVLETQAP
jgi:hypothetical protein